MNILVTGGNGFIGSKLITKLSHDNKVINFTHMVGDITDIDFAKLELQDFDLIFHLASTVDNYNILTNPYLDIHTNCNCTIALLENIRKHCPTAKLIFVSTFFVNSGEPLGLYGASKLFAEHACNIYSKVYNLNVCTARLCNVYGPGENVENNKKNAFMRLVNRLLHNKSIQIYNEDIYRDLIYIDDVISALEIIATKGKNRHIYTVGTGTKHLFKNLIKEIHTFLHSSSIIEYVEPPDFHKAVGMKNLDYEIDTLKALGWQPKFNIWDGIVSTFTFN